ncbi:ATP-binding cassette domain-containing protein [Paenibacillus sp. G2S3]|uniref:ABC transporter ATP-binding protein n=1 Tax=Paenibacillus sp. G2S3 TaxID=3047872 RepID=UPI0024C1D24F|nr:ATP-binding cassette domain-containing protein [Paenibacillus sp. G2S3]WHY19713.1 ATP-binding cassette domain-containing protein [Paenibacillus sp. G2S3]
MTEPGVPIAAGVKNLKLKFAGEDSLLFKGVSLSFHQGEKTLLLGPSGCGKSTLLQVLSGLIPGSIEVPMIAEETFVPERWGYVFQDPDTQFCMPYVDEEMAFVLENMRVPREEMAGLIRLYLAQVGLDIPDIHIAIQSLSQGMKQRLAIASVLAMEPEVIFLDEPTALLDSEGTELVWSAIRSLSEGITLIVIEHKIEGVIDFFDRIVVLSREGVVIADGSPTEIFSAKRRELQEYGIWYPGVWEDYIENKSRRSDCITRYSNANDREDIYLEMDRFRGKRGNRAVIEVGRAIVTPGQWIGIIGHNGAGKSSLLLSIMRLIKTEGICKIAGREAEHVAQAVEHIAFVFQNPEFQFVTHSVREEIEYSLMLDGVNCEIRRATAYKLMEELYLEDVASRHPYQLSMGQKRRLSVATAIVKGQHILLLDEPTFGLDARNTFSLLEKFERLLSAGASIIMVTHDARIVENFCTASWRIEDGRLTDVIDLSPPGNLATPRQSHA